MGRVAPEALQRIKLAFLMVKYVDEYFRIVHHEPLAGNSTFRRQRRNLCDFSDPFPNAAADRFQMRLRTSGADNEIIRKRRDCSQIKDDNVLGLLFFG
jgi:hypothetical protein